MEAAGMETRTGHLQRAYLHERLDQINQVDSMCRKRLVYLPLGHIYTPVLALAF